MPSHVADEALLAPHGAVTSTTLVSTPQQLAACLRALRRCTALALDLEGVSLAGSAGAAAAGGGVEVALLQLATGAKRVFLIDVLKLGAAATFNTTAADGWLGPPPREAEEEEEEEEEEEDESEDED
jgi:hypothetical protein